MELSLKKKLLFSCVMIAVMFVLFEFVGFVYLRFIHKPIGTYGYPKGLYRSDDRLDYRLTPSFRGKFTGNFYKNIVLETNSLGWREREFSLLPSPNIIRVCVLGDSITFGAGVAADVRFSRVLGEILNRKSDKLDDSIEVINLAVNSYTTYHYLEIAKQEVKEYQCNYVVVGFCLNDILPKETSFPRTRIELAVYAPRSDGTVEAEKKRPLLERISDRSYSLSMVRRLATSVLGIENPERYSTRAMRSLANWWRDENEVYVQEDLLSKIKETLTESGIALSVVVLPQRNDVDEPEVYGFSRLRLLRLLKDLKIEAIDIHPIFQMYVNSSELFLPGDSLHFSTKGHELVGKTVGSVLKDRFQ